MASLFYHTEFSLVFLGAELILTELYTCSVTPGRIMSSQKNGSVVNLFLHSLEPQELSVKKQQFTKVLSFCVLLLNNFGLECNYLLFIICSFWLCSFIWCGACNLTIRYMRFHPCQIVLNHSVSV